MPALPPNLGDGSGGGRLTGYPDALPTIRGFAGPTLVLARAEQTFESCRLA